MSVSIHIEGGSVSDIQAQMAALLAGQGRFTEAASETGQPDPKPAAAKPAETKTAKPEPKTEPKPKPSETKKPEPKTEEVEAKTETEAANDDAGDAKAETKPADAKKLTHDDVRPKALEWVNAAEPKDQDKRRELFQSMLKEFDAAKFGEIDEAKLPAVSAYIDEKVKELEAA